MSFPQEKSHVSLTLSFCPLFPEYVSPLSQENLVIKFVHKILYYATSILFTILTFDTPLTFTISSSNNHTNVIILLNYRW